MAKLIVGIDFGTSTTVVRYKMEGSKEISSVKDLNGTSDFIPSAIFRIANQKESLYGHEAINAKKGGMEGELITNFKIGLLEKNEDKRKEKESQIEEFLKFVYKRFSQATQGKSYSTHEIYVSYPAKWSDSFINFMKEAVRKAGFGEKASGIYGVNEPKAATCNMLFLHLENFEKTKMLTAKKPMHVFMLDMGAGTTDVVIFRLKVDSSGKIEIDNLISYPTVDNPYLCGGSEIDKKLSEHVVDYIQKKTNIENMDEDFFPEDSAKFWKDQIVSKSLKNNVNVSVPPELQAALKYMPNGKTVQQSFLLTKSIFENITETHWKNLYELIRSAMQLYESKYKINAEDIDLLFLTGGHSQWYTVPNLFNGEGVCGYIGKDYKIGNNEEKALNFKKLREEPWRMFSDSFPHECVALGLCLQGDTITPPSVLANNIWLKLTVSEYQTKPELILKKDTVLPHSTDYEVTTSLSRNGVFGDHEFDIVIDLYTGLSLETAKHSRLKFKKGENSFLARIILAGLLIGFLNFDYKFSLKANIIANEDGTIDINGSVIVDDKEEESSTFTKNDLEEI